MERESLHAAVVGAGVGGLAAALALSREGHRVTVIERDATPLPPDPDAAFDWNRRGAPQVRHSHALLARLRNLLRDRYPDVLQHLLDAGATEIRFGEMLPETIDDRSPQPGDDDLVALACRRTTFEWVLRQVVLESPSVSLMHGRGVDRLASSPGHPEGPPVVTGVVLDGGDVLTADLVVGAVGRRSAIPRWFSLLGVELEQTEEDTGIVYLSRFYRLRDGAGFPDAAGPIGGDLGYLKYGVFQGDNRTFSVTLAVRTHDDELRKLLLDPDLFDLAARNLTATAPWVQAERAAATTPVHVMGGLLNRRLRFTADGGEPLVLGFHALGDAHTCTNPLYGRGCSLATVQATLLADAIAEGGDDPRARGRLYEAACEREVLPWYRAAVNQDRLAREAAAAEREARDGRDPASGSVGAPSDPAAFAREVMRDGLLPAVRTDAGVFRAFIRTFNLLDPPEAMLTDPDVFGRILEVFQDRESRPPEPELGPPRREMLARLR
ncbi:NAD(P)/FAD-dependent oxidoreductase [Rhabdothermincola sediminis]|uniref:NAD(P)/FAD-dependent oxidoreductase n=1 Tax=Rhabdothermincola sediminis TaxID=2751370 RepID=UPI001AA02F43|nr:FAD-dependent oxidoreductase [Rhabdothermincola sediminis]